MTLINHIPHIICWVVLRAGKRIGVKLTSTHFLRDRNTAVIYSRDAVTRGSSVIRRSTTLCHLFPAVASDDFWNTRRRDALTDMLKPEHTPPHK